MMLLRRPCHALTLVLAIIVSSGQSRPALAPDPPMVCDACEAWNAPYEPFRIFGTTYYVGTAGLSAVLIATDAGLILLDGALPQSAVQIDRNVRALGFRTEDIRLIVNSHAHYDHAGGIAALQRVSGAQVAASEAGARALERGEPTPDDPQFAFGRAANAFPAVKGVRVVKDGEAIRIGSTSLTARYTPGHTPGATTWTWRSCEDERCLDLVYADSLNAVSAPGFRFTGDASHRGIVESFRRSIDTVAALPCDIVVAVHPAFTHLDEKLAARRASPATNPFIDRDGCRTYAEGARKGLDARVTEEGKAYAR